jgi:hypothetical protein
VQKNRVHFKDQAISFPVFYFDPKKNFGLFINFHFLSIAPVQYSLVISRVNVKLSIICSSARSAREKIIDNLTCTRGYFGRLFPEKNLHDK